MTKLSCFLLLAIVMVTLTQMSEGRRRWARKGYRDDDEGEGHGRSRVGSWGRRDRYPSIRSRHHSFDVFNLDSKNPFFSFDFLWGGEGREQEPWWKGPNVCETETEETSNTTGTSEFLRHFSSASRTCDESETAYKCKETTQTPEGRREKTVVIECCHGYTRKEGDFGCPQKLRLQNLLDKAQDLGLTDFVRAIKLLKLEKELREGNLTVFAPVNGAFGLDSGLIDTDADNNVLIQDEPHVIMMSRPSAERALESLQEAMLSHLVMGALRTSALEDEEVLETASPIGSTIRINYFVTPQKVTTANCVPFESSNHMASNGILHTLTRAMKPVTRTFLDIVRSSPELSTLKTVLAAANYVSKLDDDGKMTLLAPTNQAFEKMDARLRERLLRGDRKCLEKVLQNHLLPNVICTAALKGEARTANFLQNYVNLTKTEDGKMFANGAQLVQSDLMATNGVIHVIDAVLVPQEALNILDVLKKEGFTQLLDLIDQAGLTKTIGTADNITLFAPSNEAIEHLPQALKSRLVSKPNELAEVLKFHVSPGVKECRHFSDNDLRPSLEGSDIRLNHFHTFNAFPPFHTHKNVKTAQCVPLTHQHLEACNGRITVLDDVMQPPPGNVVDVLALDKKFSTLVSLVKRAGLADALQGDGPFTIFAPNNQAFERIDQRTLDALARDEEKLQKLLKKHVFGNTLCCEGIFQGSWLGDPQVRTLSGDLLTLDRTRDGTPKVDRANVAKCDLTATNGNVIEIDTVLVDQPPRRRHHETRRPWWERFRR